MKKTFTNLIIFGVVTIILFLVVWSWATSVSGNSTDPVLEQLQATYDQARITAEQSQRAADAAEKAWIETNNMNMQNQAVHCETTKALAIYKYQLYNKGLIDLPDPEATKERAMANCAAF
jgi:hypothetical protein